MTFQGAVIYPFAIHFPRLPNGFGDSSYEHLAFNTTGPSVTLADYGFGQAAAVLSDARRPLYTGFEPAGPPNTYSPIISGTALDNMATFFPRNDRPVASGETDQFVVSIRFAPSATSLDSMASDAYQAWSQTWPAQLQWPDRRIIGTAYLASSGDGATTLSAGFANNPRRYFNNGDASTFDINTADGLRRFQSRLMQQAADSVTNLRRLNAQGLVTWDIEGQEYPHNTSYACAPDQIAQIAPEMESVVDDPSSGYQGMKLDDAYFKTIRDAGFRVGVCIRPQHFTLYGGGRAEQAYLPSDQILGEIVRKMKYAHDRWGATLFYIDSTVDPNGGVLDPSIFQHAAALLPDSLLIPEESSPKYFAYTAPFQSFIFHTDLGTTSEVYNYYPNAFSVNLVNDADAAKLAQYRAQLTESVRRGDILMLHADYWQDNNSVAVQIYQDASPNGNVSPAPEPTPPPVILPVTPEPPLVPVEPAAPQPDPNPVVPVQESVPPVTITNLNFGATLSGSFVVKAEIQGTLDAAGSYLTVDGNEIGTSRLTTSPYSYTLDSTRFGNGYHILQVWAHNTNNNTLLSPPVLIAISN